MAWGRRPQAVALVAALTDPDWGWDAVVVGEYGRTFCGAQCALVAPLFEHYGVQFWMPEAGDRVDYASEHDEHAMTVLGLSSKREVTRTSILVRTAGGAAGLRTMRAADGIGVVQREACLPVPPRSRQRRGTRSRPDEERVRPLGYLRERGISLTWDPGAGTLQADGAEAAKTITGKAS